MSIEHEVDTVATQDNDEVEIDLDLGTEEEEQAPEPTSEKKEKPTESLEARRARLLRQLKQTESKLGLNTEKKEMAPSTSNDLGEKAYLIANGLKEADEQALAKKLAKETGKDYESLLATTYFQTELKDFREKKASADATPTGSKRSNNSSVDTVDYWIAKGELPPASEIDLRRKVVNTMMKKEESKGQFYNS